MKRTMLVIILATILLALTGCDKDCKENPIKVEERLDAKILIHEFRATGANLTSCIEYCQDISYGNQSVFIKCFEKRTCYNYCTQ